MGVKTNAVCTVVRADDESRVTFSGKCMWQETRGFSAGKNGENKEDVTVVFLPIAADVIKGDSIIRGEISDCEKVLRQGLTVKKVIRCDFGSVEMQHLEVEAV